MVLGRYLSNACLGNNIARDVRDIIINIFHTSCVEYILKMIR